MLKIQRKVLLDSDEDDNEDDKVTESSENSDESESRPIKAYKQYMTKVISFMITTLEPSIDLEKVLPNIKEASEIAVGMTKVIYKVSENIQKK